MKRQGYTLVELLAVLLIISLISAMAITFIVRKSNEMRTLSNKQLENMIISSAKSYINTNDIVKTKIRSGIPVEIEYTKLKGYLPDKMINITTYNDININNYSVCAKYSNYKYSYTIVTKGNCH